MNPLLIAGAASAVSFATDFISKLRNGSSASQAANTGQAAKNAAAKFDDVLQTQTALNAQQAQTEAAAKLAAPMTPEAQTVALEAFNARQENISERIQKGQTTGQLTSDEVSTLQALQAQAQTNLDSAMSDGVLTVGEFKQMNATFDTVSRQVASYRFNQQMGAAQTGSSSTVNATV